MIHQAVSCLVRERFQPGTPLRQVTVSLDWTSIHNEAMIEAAEIENQNFPLAKGFLCEASIETRLWIFNPKPWESIVPIVTGEIRRRASGGNA